LIDYSAIGYGFGGRRTQPRDESPYYSDAMQDTIELPEAFVLTDAISIRSQQTFITSTRIQLLLLVVASAAGSFSWAVNGGWDWTALLAGVAFTAAAGLRLALLRSKPHRTWYDGRAAAESIKTLAWKYAAAGEPFTTGYDDADARFRGLVRDVLTSFDSLGEIASSSSIEPTPIMQSTRALPLAERKQLYSRGRIGDQLHWYTSKANWNARRARFWGRVVLGLQVLAATGAFLKGFGIVDIDIFGLAAAAVASAAAWLETKQHDSVARAYRVAAEELASIQGLIDEQTTEESWGRFVAEAEEAVSREHTMWRASSRSREPASLA
jgi:hypothetical protein